MTPVPVVVSPQSQSYETITPSGSKDALASAIRVKFLPSIVRVKEMLGAIGPRPTVTGRWNVSVRPSSSVTVSTIRYVPASAYACDVTMPTPVVVSPQSHAYVTMTPSGSVEPEASTFAVRPTTRTVKNAVGQWRTVTLWFSVPVRPMSSVTV